MPSRKSAKKLVILSKKSDPRYLEIATHLRELLMDGHFKPGQRFLSIRQLIRETKRSLPTVRSALNLMVEEGLLEARPGSGFYVTEKVDERREQSILRLLVIIPSYSSPREPWFTGRIVAGMLKAAEDKNVVISFYQRKIIDSFRKPTARYAAESEAVADRNLEHILAFRPDGVAWLHAAATDVPQMLRLLEQKVPTVSTKRHLPGVEVPILREDDLVFASLALTQFQARGHRRIGLIIRSPEDDYFKSKIEALETVGKSLGITVEPSDYFCLEASPADLTANASESTITDLEAFLLQRPQVTGMLVVAASGIHALIEILRRNQSRQLQQLSIIHNTLDGVRIPPLPGGHSLATISPPLEDLGNQIVHALTKVAQRQPMPDMPRLVPTFQPGTSLKTAPPAEE